MRYAPLVCAASFTLMGFLIWHGYQPRSLTDSSKGLICMVGAGLALLGYGVGTLIKLAKG